MDYNLSDVHGILTEVSDKIAVLSKEVKCSRNGRILKEGLTKLKHDALVDWLFDFTNMLGNCQEVLKSTSGKVDEMKDTIISLQKAKISNQEELLEIRQQAINSFHSTLKTEMKSYRDVVQSSSSNISQQCVTNAVKQAVKEDDRSKNIVLFGAEERDGTDKEDQETENVVLEILENVGEKPNIMECCRMGKRSAGGRPRPIKVCLRSPDTAKRILANSRLLKDSPTTKHVYIAPDRTNEEREARKKLVGLLKGKIQRDPTKFHFISGSEVVSKEKESEHLPKMKGSDAGRKIDSKILQTSKSNQNSVQLNEFDKMLERAKQTQLKLSLLD